MRDQEMTIGLHVSVAAVDSVCEYLHGTPGIVEALNVGKDFDGTTIHRIKLLEPRSPAKYWPDLTTLRVRADQITG